MKPIPARLGTTRNAIFSSKAFEHLARAAASVDSGEAGPSQSRPQQRPARRSARDGTYRPDRRRRPSDGDDDYREGEVPEPQPDLSISAPAGGSRKRARDTTATGAQGEGEAEAEAEAGSSETAAAAGSLAKKPRTEDVGGDVVVISDGSSIGESGLDTPSSRSENEEEEGGGKKKRSPGRPRGDKSKGKALSVAAPVARRSSPRVTRSQAVHEEEEQDEEEQEEEEEVIG